MPDIELIPVTAQPKSWHGVRDNEPAHRILDEEWVDAREVDSRTGGRRGGLVQVSVPAAAMAVFGMVAYRRPDGTLHLVAYTNEGKLYDDGVLVVSGLSTTARPHLFPGNGTVFLMNAVNPPYWRDPLDDTWKVIPQFPATWYPQWGTFHPLSKRLYVAPTEAGVDYFAWSNADFIGTNLSFVSAGGGGSEYIGGSREPITGIHHGLGDDTCIFTTDHIYQIRGLDPSNWRPRFISGDVGCTAGKTICLIGHGLFFVHTSGAYLVNALGAITFPPLTTPKQTAWDALIKNYEAYLPYAHASWNPQEHTVYLFIPTTSSQMMGQLWKLYLPDGSISIHDVAAYSSCTYPSHLTYIGRSDGIIAKLQDGNDDLGTPITGWLRSKIYGDPGKMYDWGVQQKMVMLFKPVAGGSVKVKPIIYAQHERGIVEGDLQTINLDQTGDEIRATIYLPEASGWGIQFYIEGTSAWKWTGFFIEATKQDIE